MKIYLCSRNWKLTKQQWLQAEGAHVMGPVRNERNSLHMPNLSRKYKNVSFINIGLRIHK